MLRHHTGHPVVAQVLDDWTSLNWLAVKENKLKKGESKKTVWELLERVAPIPLKNKEDEWIVMRILFNKVERKHYLDLRVFKRVEGKFVKTGKGIHLPVGEWSKQLTMIENLMVKYI